ncbi:MAG: hypothetical protein AB1641_07685 [Thermodesulfobacteriota bacterium]
MSKRQLIAILMLSPLYFTLNLRQRRELVTRLSPGPTHLVALLFSPSKTD